MKKTTIQPLNQFLKKLISIEAELDKQGFEMKVGIHDKWLYWNKGKRIKIPKLK